MAQAPSITAKAGFRFILKVAEPGVSPTEFVTVGGLRNTSLTINNNPADITNAGSNGFRELLPEGGIQSFSLSSDGVFDSLTDGARIVWTEAVNRDSLIEFKLESAHGDYFLGQAVVSQVTRTGAFDGAETFNISLESSGTITYSPYP